MQSIKSFFTQQPVAAGAAVLSGLLRLIQVITFSPVGALSIYSGARIRGLGAFVLPLLVMVVTDWILAGLFYGAGTWTWTTPFGYAAFVLNILLGRLVQKTENPVAVVGVSLVGTVQFFLTTNLGVWMTTSMYEKTFAGLVNCYVAALPFLRTTLVSDLLFVSAIFLAYHFLAQKFSPRESVVRA